MTGRPKGNPAWAEDWQEQFLERVRSGVRSVNSISKDDDMPSSYTIYKVLDEDSEFAEKYARATTERADVMLEEVFDIADDNEGDVRKLSDGREIVDKDHIQRARLRVDTRKWAMGKMAPKKYGDKVDMTVDVRGSALSEEEQVSRIEALIPQIAPILVGLGWTPPDEPDGDEGG